MKNKLFSTFLSITFLLTIILGISGCKGYNELIKSLEDVNNEDAASSDKPEFVITIHSIVKYPRGTKLERRITGYSGRSIWININPFLHSRNIEDIQLIPDPIHKSFKNIRIKLNRRGRLMWMQLSVEFKNKPLALVIDGMFYRLFTPTLVIDEKQRWVTIKGPIDEVTAKALQKHAKTNYEYYHQNDSSNPVFGGGDFK
jgi:hypothetical protein